MATLREQLAELYPQVLPTDPTTPIIGTALLAVVKPKLVGDYADQTIRQHFSVMSAEPTSAIAKVSQGYGYYLRPVAAQAGPDLDAVAGAGAKNASGVVTPDLIGAQN